MSGDEFVFLSEDLAHTSDVEILAARIEHAFTEPFTIAGVDMTISASVGMAFAGPGQKVTNQLVVDADIAMYQAKRKGGAAHQIIDVREAQATSSRHGLEQELRRAFANDQLDLDYQPIVRATDGLTTRVGALLRWTHPLRGPIATTDMVGIAEDSGLITGIGAWVLQRACTDREHWYAEHPHAPLTIAVNVSARQLLGPAFVTKVSEVLAVTGMAPDDLVLEMTEGIFIGDADRALTVLRDLKGLGVRLALDDFGTGYCSLNYLRQFPVDIVKIDQAFTRSIDQESAGAAIVAPINHLAHVLDLTVTADGVESTEQRNGITAVGCDAAQGFFFARPMPAPAIRSMLQDSNGHELLLPKHVVSRDDEVIPAATGRTDGHAAAASASAHIPHRRPTTQ